MAVRIWFKSGVCANFTYTSVPPLKSTPNGMPCQKKMDNSPATLKISEKARKYHFLPRKSIFVFLKNSTASPLNAQSLATLVAIEDGVENNARYKNGSEQVGGQTKAEGHGKSAHRTGPEQEQDDGRHNRRYVGIDDGDPGLTKPLLHRGRRRLAVPQLFADALKDEHVRVHAHTYGQDHTRDSGQGQRRSGESEESQQDHQVHDQAEVRVNARKPVINEHEGHD